ncbi:hypothetical protein B0H16DRAFT_1476979 [Mycena metata]|uniref:Polyketide synthase n=1 Tax=Mycena metata TaxID=1033252 RepID=A0AAD7HAR8_9AGAR|nr:hypothetical protein B0H16DRAFT_1476979 [Mycena metata]
MLSSASVFWGLAVLMVSGFGPQARVHAASVVTLYDVPSPSTSNVALVDAVSFSLSVDGVGTDGATTYVDFIVKSYEAEVLPSTTTTIEGPYTATATLVENASGYRLTSPDVICINGNCTVDTAAPPAVRTCAFGADGQGSCVLQAQAQVGSIAVATMISWSGAVVPGFTLAAATSAPKANGAAALLRKYMHLGLSILGPSWSHLGSDNEMKKDPSAIEFSSQRSKRLGCTSYLIGERPKNLAKWRFAFKDPLHTVYVSTLGASKFLSELHQNVFPRFKFVNHKESVLADHGGSGSSITLTRRHLYLPLIRAGREMGGSHNLGVIGPKWKSHWRVEELVKGKLAAELVKEPIAIVGIAAELPSGEHSTKNLSHESFHEFILDGRDAYEKIPRERMNVDAWEGRGVGKTSVTRGSFLKDVGLFDATEFGIGSKDARAMAVATRRLIEISFLALLDSGIDYRGRSVGCYAAGSAYNIIAFADPAEFESTSSLAGNPCMLANKISYHLDLRGPSIPVDTACSSSAVAMHMAVQDIRNGACEAAFDSPFDAELINIRLCRASDWASYSQAGITAPDGICKPFDAGGNGFARGEGAVSVVLKPLDKALQDGDHIYGTVLGTAVTSCGSLAPVNAPVAESQADAMVRAYAGTGRVPAEVDYVEVHGTGTAAGDPAEANWVGEHFGGRAQELIIGSVKGNVGQTSQLAPQAHLTKLNPSIHWADYNMRVARKPEHLSAQNSSGKHLVSVCSSGIGGVNVHVVLEGVAAPTSASGPETATTPVLLIAGGLTPRSATAVGEDLIQALGDRDESTVDFSVVLGRRARPLTWRSFAVKQPGEKGPQHINMGRQLFARYPVFRQTVLELDECHKKHTGTSLINDFGLFTSTQNASVLPPVWPISLILPSVAVLQLALFDLLTSFNLHPNLLIGHSAGETALLYASGAGPKEMALEIAIARGQAMTFVEENAAGTMAALSCAPSVAEGILKQVKQQHPEGVAEIACYNSPDAVALAGHAELLDEAVALAKKEGIMATRIMTSVPVHSSLMDLYFWENSRSPVLFVEAMRALLHSAPNAQIVELGAHPVLSGYVAELGAVSATITPMRRSKTYIPHQEQTTLLTALGSAFVAGCVPIDFNAINGRAPGSVAPRPKLPAYPFAKKPVEIYPEYSRIMHRQMSDRLGPLNHPDLRVNVATHPELEGHLINQEPIMPAAGFVEMALEFGAKSLWNIKFHSMLSLSATSPTPVEVLANGKYFSVKSHPVTGKYFNFDPASHRLHADGYFSSELAQRPADLDLRAIRARCVNVDTKNFYDELNHFANYGPTYRRLDELHVGGREVLARIKGLTADLAKDGNYVLHPAILDAALHSGIHPRVHMVTDPNVYYLPERVNSMFVYDTLDRELQSGEHVYSYATFQAWTPSELIYDMVLVTASGRHLCKLEGYVMARHLQVQESLDDRHELLFRPFNSDPNVIRVKAPQELYTNMLKHIIKECGKPDLRILEFQSNGNPALEAVLAEIDIVRPSFFLVGQDPTKAIAADTLPRYFTALDTEQADLDEQTIDLIILPHDGVNFALLKRLSATLVPGGFIVQTTVDSGAAQTEFCHAGFSNITISSGSVYAQAPLLPTALPATTRPTKEVLMIPYAVGNEMAIKTPLATLDEAYEHPIWLVAPEGYHAAGLQGFGRSLRREYPQWNIRLVAFASFFSEDERAFIIENFLPKTGMECEFLVDQDLCIKVPRITPSPAPTKQAGSLARTNGASLGETEVRIEAEYVAFSETGVWVVAGTVTAAGLSANPHVVGEAVLAVMIKRPSKIVRVSQDVVAIVPDRILSQALVESIAPMVFALLALGDDIIARPSDFKGRVIVSHTENDVGRIILGLCKHLKLRHSALSAVYSAEELSKLRLNAEDVFLTASDPKDELLSCYAPPAAQVCSWIVSSTIETCLRRHPRRVVKVLEGLCAMQGLKRLLGIRGKAPDGPPSPAPQLFSGDKSYILIGGVGSVGPYIALWMYQNGARDIVLTSRSGRETLKKLKDSLPGRVFDYVEQLADLNLFVEAVDGSQPSEMVRLIGGLNKPLGGVFLLAATFDDRLFVDQEAETFTKSFLAKVGCLRALEAAVDIASLDFLVSLSSGTTFGNHGQTNYTSANTALDGLLKKYRNAFTIATPLVHDTTIATRRVAVGWVQWGCSPTEMCAYIEDGLRKLADGPLNIYVPALDFALAMKNIGPSVLYDHLLSKTSSVDSANDSADLGSMLTPLLLQFIDVAAEDFSREVPFTAYGLDSLSAGRLSIALRPWIVISQMQLLADMALEDLEARITTARACKSRGDHEQHDTLVKSFSDLALWLQPRMSSSYMLDDRLTNAQRSILVSMVHLEHRRGIQKTNPPRAASAVSPAATIQLRKHTVVHPATRFCWRQE